MMNDRVVLFANIEGGMSYADMALLIHVSIDLGSGQMGFLIAFVASIAHICLCYGVFRYASRAHSASVDPLNFHAQKFLDSSIHSMTQVLYLIHNYTAFSPPISPVMK